MANTGAEKKPVKPDWHRADIVAALHKANWSLAQLGIVRGLGRKTIAQALDRPYPRAERIIAETLGLRPDQIWPSRYGSDGKPNRARGPHPKRGLSPSAGSVARDNASRNLHAIGSR